MACSIVATAGSASANSYCTIAEGTTYHETHVSGATWEDSDDDTRCRALQTATRVLDQWYDWAGSVVGSTQALLWPRSGVVGPNGYTLASDSIPTLIKHATAELARQLIAEDRTADSDTKSIASLQAGSVSIAFRPTAANPIPDAVAAMVSALGVPRSKSGGAVSLYRS